MAVLCKAGGGLWKQRNLICSKKQQKSSGLLKHLKTFNAVAHKRNLSQIEMTTETLFGIQYIFWIAAQIVFCIWNSNLQEVPNSISKRLFIWIILRNSTCYRNYLLVSWKPNNERVIVAIFLFWKWWTRLILQECWRIVWNLGYNPILFPGSKFHITQQGWLLSRYAQSCTVKNEHIYFSFES